MAYQHVSRWSAALVLCLCSMAHFGGAHPCGENPLRRLVPLTRILNGVIPNGDVNAILDVLRSSQPELYRQIQEEWQAYSRCIGLVDTGYFKRSSGRSPKMATPPSGLGEATSKELEEKMNLLVDLLQGALYLDDDVLKSGQGTEGEQ